MGGRGDVARLGLRAALALAPLDLREPVPVPACLGPRRTQRVGDVKLWRALTFGSIFFCAGLYQVIAASMHHPVYPDKTMPYMQKRSKAFPWGDGDTPLFAQLFGYPHGHPKADEHHH